MARSSAGATFAMLLSVSTAMGCGRAPEPSQAARATPPPAPAASASDKAFFGRLSRSEPSDVSGRVELRNEGILIHPGDKKPTTATFRLDKQVSRLTVRLFIAPLDAKGLAVPEAGTVNVEILADGKALLAVFVDRTIRVERILDLTGVAELTVRVDNANGKSWWDWLILSVTA